MMPHTVVTPEGNRCINVMIYIQVEIKKNVDCIGKP